MYCETCIARRYPKRTCADCGTLDLPRRRKRCIDCQTKRDPKCVSCGAEKPRVQGRKLCDACLEVSIAEGRSRHGATPCKKCGSVENKLPQKQLCTDCKESAEWQRKAKRSARAPRRRKACAGCGGPKEAGHRRRYCDACRAKREGPRACNECGAVTVTKKHAKACDECKAESLERQRARHREHARRVMQDPERRARVLEQRAAYRKTQKGRAKERERSRMRYRLKVQQEGRELLKHYDVEVERSQMPMVEAAPLIPFLKIACRNAVDASPDRGVTIALRSQAPGASLFAEQAGVDERVVREVCTGVRARIEEDVAERIAIAMGMTLLNIYTEERAA